MHAIIARLAVPAEDSERICQSLRASIPKAFDGAETEITSFNGRNVFVSSWYTHEYFVRGVRTALIPLLPNDYCFMEMLSDNASFNKLEKGWLCGFLYAKSAAG